LAPLDRLPLHFSPSPLLYRAFGGDLDALVHHMRKLTSDAIQQIHLTRKGRSPSARSVSNAFIRGVNRAPCGNPAAS
jgi:hypothetical protein